MESEVLTMIIIDEGGLPRYFMKNNQTTDLDDNSVLISGFVTAFSNFLSEVLQSEKEIIQFAQQEYEGIIDKLESGYYYTVIGKNLFKNSPFIYDQFFQFLDIHFVKNSERSINEESEQIRSLIHEIISSDSNYELFVSQKTQGQSFLWSAHSATTYDYIDGVKNVKELSLTTEIGESETFAILKIFEWQQAVILDLELRDYMIFQKTDQALLLSKRRTEESQQMEEYFPDALNLLREINGAYNIGQLKSRLSDTDVEMNLTILIEQNLVETISNEQTLNILIFEYLQLIYSSLTDYFEVEREKIFEELRRETSILTANLLNLDSFGLHSVTKINNSLYQMGYTFDEVLENFMELIDFIHDKLLEISKEKTEQLFGFVFSNLIEKHSFTLERMNLLNILCPEEYI